MLDGVCDYLPNPSEVANTALDRRQNEATVKLIPYNSLPFCGLAFKLEESNFGQLTYIRVYQGKLRKGQYLYNARNDRRVKIPRIVRMHSNEMEEVPEVGAGEICAVFGVDCASGDTFTDGQLGYSMTSMFRARNLSSVCPSSQRTTKNSLPSPKQSPASNAKTPHSESHFDAESRTNHHFRYGRTPSRSVRLRRMRREYKVDCETGQPQVAYRETVYEAR